MERRSLNSLERAWVLYDVGNSAFILMVSTLIPIYFNYLSEHNGVNSIKYLSYWGYAASLSTVAVGVLGPILGAIADMKDLKKPLFFISLVFGVLGCVTLGIYSTWIVFLAVYVLTKILYSISLIFYDSMLNDVTSKERLDYVSSQGYGWGYIGSCVPFIVSLILVLEAEKIGIEYRSAMRISFVITGLWWLVITIPLLKRYKQIYFVNRKSSLIKGSFQSIFKTLKDLKNHKQIALFLIAYFLYIDGVYTIIEMATAYGKTLGFDSTGLLLSLLVGQFVAFPSSILIGKLSMKYEAYKLIIICIAAYTFISIFALFMTSQLHFWILAILVGMFQGGIQALSRSHFTKIIPAEKSGEYFGVLDICGKGASFVGTTLVAVITQVTGSAKMGVFFLSILFIFGLYVFIKSNSLEQSYRCC